MTCGDHNTSLPCESYTLVGFSEEDVYQLLIKCPKTCGLCESLSRKSLLEFLSKMQRKEMKSSDNKRIRAKEPAKPPTKYPTIYPTRRLTQLPTPNPTKNPTKSPSWRPTKFPTKNPIKRPTRRPTKLPTKNPTKSPTQRPTELPTKNPTNFPTKHPTKYPTKQPTKYPTKRPTKNPTSYPTRPTQIPTKRTTLLPTGKPISKINKINQLLIAGLDGCKDSPTYETHMGLGCVEHKNLNCHLVYVLGFTPVQMTQLLRNCPVTCELCSD